MTAYDVRDLTYQGVNVTLGGLNMSGAVFKPDGLNFWVVENDASTKIYTYLMSTAWNIGTAAKTAAEFTLTTGSKGLEMNADGTKLYYCRAQLICERTMSGAYDITTAGAESTLNTASDVAAGNPRAIRWGDSGNKLFWTDDTTQIVRVYDASSAYAISSCTISSDLIDLSVRFPDGAGLSGLFLRPNGLRLFVGVNFVSPSTTPAMRQYDLPVAWTLANATEVTTVDAFITDVSAYIPFIGSSAYDWARGKNPSDIDSQSLSVVRAGALYQTPPEGDGGYKLVMRYDYDDNEAVSVGNGGAISGDVQFKIGRHTNPGGPRPYNVPLFHPRLTWGFHGQSNVFPNVSSSLAPFCWKWLDTTDHWGVAIGTGLIVDTMAIDAGAAGGNWDYLEDHLWTVEADDVSGDGTAWMDGNIIGTATGRNLRDGPDQAPLSWGLNPPPGGSGGSPELTSDWGRITRSQRYNGLNFDAAIQKDLTAFPLIGKDISPEVGDNSAITAIFFSSDGAFAYAVSTENDTMYQYNLGVIVPSCSGAGFNAYDSGGTVRLNVTSVGGAHHLEGADVSVVVDGQLFTGIRVVNGSPVLPDGTSGAHIQMGFPFTTDIETLDITDGEGSGVGKHKRVTELLLKFYKSVMPLIGPDENRLTRMKHPDKYNFNDPLALLTGDVRQHIDSDWNSTGKVMIRQTEPYPLTILAIAPDVPEMEDDN